MKRSCMLVLLGLSITSSSGCSDEGFGAHDRMEVMGPDGFTTHVDVYHDLDGPYYYMNGVKVYIKTSPGGDAPDRPHEYDPARD